MTPSTNLDRNNRLQRNYLRWWIWLFPIAILSIQLIGRGWNFVASGYRIPRAIASDAASGSPITRQAMLESFFRSTSQEKSVPFKRLMLEFSALENGAVEASFWTSDPGQNTPLVPTGGVWQEEPLYGAYLSQAKPLIDKLESLLVSDRVNATEAPRVVVPGANTIEAKPVWQPVQINGDGFTNAMFHLGDLNIALIREFDYAIHVGDWDRAIRAIQLEFAVLQMFDWKKSISAEWRRQFALERVYSHITHSLESDLWTVERLETLQQSILIPLDLPSRWRSVIEAERVGTLEQLSKPGWFSSQVEFVDFTYSRTYVDVPKTRQWNWLQASEGITDLGNFGYENLVKLAREKQTAMDLATGLVLNESRSDESQPLQNALASWKIDLVGFAKGLTSLERARTATMEAVMNKKNDLLAKTSATSPRD